MKLRRRNRLKSLERTILTIGLLLRLSSALLTLSTRKLGGQVWAPLRLCFLLRTKMVRNKI